MILDPKPHLIRDSRLIASLRPVVNLPALYQWLEVTDTDRGMLVTFTPRPFRASSGQVQLLEFIDAIAETGRPTMPDLSHLDDDCKAAVLAAFSALLVPAQRGGEDR
jgi:hypothetical protein